MFPCEKKRNLFKEFQNSTHISTTDINLRNCLMGVRFLHHKTCKSRIASTQKKRQLEEAQNVIHISKIHRNLTDCRMGVRFIHYKTYLKVKCFWKKGKHRSKSPVSPFTFQKLI